MSNPYQRPQRRHPATRGISLAIFASRWLQAPLYVGLIGVLALICIRFFSEFVHVTSALWGGEESKLVLLVLSLVDLVMVANLVIMVIISGYENFVSKFDEEDKVHWLGEIDANSLKIKVASTIVAISSIHLLQIFLNVDKYSGDQLMWYTLIHIAFVVSALFLAFIDRVSAMTKALNKSKPPVAPKS